MTDTQQSAQERDKLHSAIWKIANDLRGAVTLADLQKIVPDIVCPEKPAPENLKSPVFLMAQNEIADFLKENPNLKIALLSFTKPANFKTPPNLWIKTPENPQNFAQQIYAILHRAESFFPEKIILQTPPETAEWQTLWHFFHGQRHIFLKKI